ncbi:SDR family oxidoreductase [Mesorhizobium sp. 1B3]|uniref:SDR family oxidoreductase n=1 Tax=Mesorhizobium sp. 1B3 TaxID=3243599 RepID=UPI003D9767C6
MNSTTNVLITGAARRIGRAIAEDLAAHGFGVVIHCNRSRDEAEQLAMTIGERGGKAVVVQADLADLDAAARLFREAETAIGPISILVNNASLFEDDSIRDFAWDLWDRHFDVHLKAPSLLARNLDAALPAGAQGLVVNIIDQRVWRPTPRYFSYTLSKSALWTATQTMAQALAPRVRVNAIGPGPTLANSRQKPEDFQAQVDGLILGHGPVLAEFGATVRYLWQTHSITGQMIALDGGQHLAWQTPDVTGMKE